MGFNSAFKGLIAFVVLVFTDEIAWFRLWHKTVQYLCWDKPIWVLR